MSDDPKTSPDPLPGDSWETRLTKQVARTVNHYRRASGLTTKAFAQLCNIEFRGNGDAGPQEIRPTTLNNLFAGKRKSIGLGEIMLFARVLGVAPVALMTPVGVETDSEAWPSGLRPSEAVFDAIVGIESWGSLFEEVAASVALTDGGQEALDRHSAAFEQSRVATIDRSRRITELLLRHGRCKQDLLQRAVLFTAPPASLSDIDINALTAAVRSLASDLRSTREKLRAEGVELSALSSMLSWIDVVAVSDLTDEDIRVLVTRGAGEAGDRFLFFNEGMNNGTPTNSAQ
ncbi:NAD-glutamate dehydrogenase [Microbacterium saperdae]|uniref:Uncharacterized protein n=1 Tax=Microbacterium saperdae TaxID=69368 RepID=A0A543BQZ6_9MICO|nr:NAD-glutamate dehydrogenase [Microbacterium saperdae]TQL87237.1 hypothetical protein FB560_2904 [Microbacterium saperdae]GGM41902.1 hypothetical protein GCM10010489_11110 [Microbacterium saperdae]